MASFFTYYGMMLAGDRERFAEALPLIEQAVSIARRVGPEITAINISRGVAWTYLLDGRFDEARRHIEKTMSELERLGQREQLSDLYLGARWMQDRIRFYSDDLDAGAAIGARETYELAVQAGNRTIQSFVGHRPGAHVATCADSRTRRSVGRIAASSRRGDRQPRRHPPRRGGWPWRRAVDLGDPHPMSRYADVIEEGIHTGGNLLLSIGLAVESFLAVGDYKRAERMARKAYELAAGRLREMLCTVALGDVAQHLGPAHYAEAASWYERALSLARALGSRSGLALASSRRRRPRPGAGQYGGQRPLPGERPRSSSATSVCDAICAAPARPRRSRRLRPTAH